MAVFDNVYAAIACYTVFQMVAMALIILYCICVLYRYNAGKKLCFFFLLFYALVPYNGIYSVTLWKDILFSGVMLIFALSLYQLLHLENEGEHLTKAALAERLPLFIKLCLFGLLLILMRSNGLYVFLLTVPFLLFSLRKEYRLLLPALAIVLGLSLLIKGPLYHALGVEKPAFSESISIPAQQIARVVYEGRELSEEQIQLLEQTVDYDSIASYYQPKLSDPIKALIQYGNPEYLETHKLEYLKLWLSLGISYPLDYWNAFVDQTKGYWFPAAPGLLTNEGISPNEEGLSWQPILRGAIVWKTVEILGKLYTIFPLYGLLYSPGAFTLGSPVPLCQLPTKRTKEEPDSLCPFLRPRPHPLSGHARGQRHAVYLSPGLLHAAADLCQPGDAGYDAQGEKLPSHRSLKKGA